MSETCIQIFICSAQEQGQLLYKVHSEQDSKAQRMTQSTAALVPVQYPVFSQAGCHSCHPNYTVSALKALYNYNEQKYIG